MNLDEKALAFLQEHLGAAQKFEDVPGPDGELRPVFDRQVFLSPPPKPLPTADSLNVSNLRSFAEYVLANSDRLPLKDHLIHVESPWRVVLLGPIAGFERARECPLTAVYGTSTHCLDSWMDLEQAIIFLMSQCAEAGDRDELLAQLKSVTREGTEISEDDGLSQRVTTAKGVRLRDTAKTLNPVRLAPFRSFPEAGEQIISPFILRLRGEGRPEVLLKVADGGAWQETAVAQVAESLRNYLDPNGEHDENHPRILY